ncbi:DUF1702 family protein [Dactylosporangium sp. NPDC051485]|uniref:DUF1702 family protein n=1 Tax=Dactylosporangium sp. NPDC051485 TaxID=3154846 RepID=UPI003439ED79
MSGLLGAFRRRILTPNMADTKIDVRGFYKKDENAREVLENIGRYFVTGYAYAAEAGAARDAEAPLEEIPVRFRGFAYEGAAMCLAIRDGMPIGHSHHVEDFLAGRGDQHVYMAYVGVGWAMARLPRMCWSRLHAPDPLLRWLVLDGYGFHQAYFHTRRYVHEQYRTTGFSWPAEGPSWYADRVIDQGIGRAMWFVGGTDVQRVAALLDAYAPERRADMYSGAGLAATYAGGAAEDELLWFWEHAGRYQAQVAQGSAFAAGARVRAGLVVPHNEIATKIFCGLTTQQASDITDLVLPDRAADGDLPGYELWRQRIAHELPSVRG